MAATPWHALSLQEIVARLNVHLLRGLNTKEIEARLRRFGFNEIEEVKRRTWLHFFLDQFLDFMILLLIAAAGVSFWVGNREDALAITAILLLNAIIGAIQEWRAERAIAALKRLAVPSCRVRRDGKLVRVSARELVPGDVAVLEAGDVVPADLRLLEVAGLQVDESSLTGESRPVLKDPGVTVAVDTPLALP